MRLFLTFIIISWLCAAQAALVSTSVGRVGSEIVTSRQVVMNHMVENALYRANAKPTLKLDDVNERAFVREITAVLLETAIFFEAESFNEANVKTKQIESQIKKAQTGLKKHALWSQLQVTTEELNRLVLRKVRAKDFIRFKIDSATIPITDKEAEDYFNANRLKFENLPYENFKTNIKAYLTKQQVDRRLKEWFELLQSKYRVRNFLSE
jgi:hypothetical protein